MKISIIGSGAMGSLFGGKLSAAGHDVVLYDINREHVDAVNKNGLVIETLSTGEKETVRPSASTEPEAVSGSDVMVVFVKSTATAAVANQFSRFAGPETIAVTLQNGLGNEDIIKGVFGAHRTAAGVTSQGATFAGPGHIKHAGNGPTHICMSDRSNSRLDAFKTALVSAGFETILDDDIASLVWSKLIINVGINALTALTGLKNGELLEYEDTKEIMKDLVLEAAAVAGKAGIELTHKDPVEAVFQVAEKTALNRSSMLQDFDRGSASEIDFINNAIVREAAKYVVDVPVNRTVTGLVRTIENRRKKC